MLSWEALLSAWRSRSSSSKLCLALFPRRLVARPTLTFNFTEKALIALAMALLIIAGEIDLSVAAIIALASTLMGLALQFGVGTPVLVAIGIGVGLVCGAFNGLLVTGLGLPSIVVTIGTMSLFRGIAFIILGDQAFKGYPGELRLFRPGLCLVGGLASSSCCSSLSLPSTTCVLHRTSFGRAHLRDRQQRRWPRSSPASASGASSSSCSA